MHKVIRPGTVDAGRKSPSDLFVTIKYADGRLSITGVEGPMRNGDCHGSCGQCGIAPIVEHAPGWDAETVERLRQVWDRWHLNDMRAGSPVQMDWLRANPVTAVYPESHYEKVGAALADAGINPDADGYRYGHAWKQEDVPADVIDWLVGLPDADRPSPWGN